MFQNLNFHNHQNGLRADIFSSDFGYHLCDYSTVEVGQFIQVPGTFKEPKTGEVSRSAFSKDFCKRIEVNYHSRHSNELLFARTS